MGLSTVESPREDKVLAAVAEQAAWWFVTNRSGSASHAERTEEAFAEWLLTSPVHVREYLAIATLARDVLAVAAEGDMGLEQVQRSEKSEPDNVVEFAPASVALAGDGMGHCDQTTHRRWFVPSLAAGLLVVSIAIVSWILIAGGVIGGGQIYRTAHGEQQVVPLRDGSLLRLNSDSEVKVLFSKHERRVELRRGQALFEVAHEPARRFRVVVGGFNVIAIGTQFDVYRRPTDTIVTVVEGKVAVFPVADHVPEESRSANAGAPTSIPVAAGEQLRVERAAKPRLISFTDDSESEPRVKEAVAWVRQQVIFEHKSLVEVVEEFNRYLEVTIHVEDPELQRLEVSGIFNAYDTHAFLLFLQRLDDLRVEKTSTGIYVMPARSVGSPEPVSIAQ